MQGDNNENNTLPPEALPLSPEQIAAFARAEELDRYRRRYYWVYFSQILLVIGYFSARSLELRLLFDVLTILWATIFLWMFLKTALFAGLSLSSLVPIAILLLIPVLGLITLLAVDFYIADTVDRGFSGDTSPKLSRLSYWSIIVGWCPPLGLPMAIIALYQIHVKRGKLTGKGFATAGLVVNLLVTIFIASLILQAMRGSK
jgi:hypothetical protein